MSGKWALIIANSDYSDPKLATLTAPSKDAGAFAEVLKAPDLAAFDDVTTIVNQPESVARRAIAKFFMDRRQDDLLLLYFSGHGIRDDQGHLFLAMPDTDSSVLDATAVPADFVTRHMDNSRSRRQLLILDCCNSGAFASGTKGSSGASMGTGGAFEGNGFGRVVLTATDATQFAWEGDKIIGEETANSLFTHFLVKGLEGEADGNGDSIITVDELYDFVYTEIVRRTPKQTPGKWSYKEQGEIVLSTKVRPYTVKPLPLDPDLEQDLQSTRNYIREAAVSELGNLLRGPNLGRALSAELKLRQVAEHDDSRAIASKAAQLLEQYQASRGNQAAIAAGPPAIIEPLPVSKAEPALNEQLIADSAPLASATVAETLSSALPAPHVEAPPSKLSWRKYALLTAISVVVLGVIGLAWRTLQPASTTPRRGTPASIPISDQQPSTATIAAATVAPLLGNWGIDYFRNTDLSGAPVHRAVQAAEKNTDGGYSLLFQTVDTLNIPELTSGNFSLRLSGLFYFSGGVYDFKCQHLDGCRVYVDGMRRIDAWSDGSGTHDATANVAAGNHAVSIEYYDKSVQGSLQLSWRIQPQPTPSPSPTATATSTATRPPTAIPTKKKSNGSSSGGRICLAFGTWIDTPYGPVPVQDLSIGDVVWTQDASGRRIAMPITATRQAAVPAGSELLHLVLSDGRQVWVSPRHPSAEGRPISDLRPGDWLDGAQVVRVESFLYTHTHTYDLLPAGPTGVYWADRILLGSTLKYDVAP